MKNVLLYGFVVLLGGVFFAPSQTIKPNSFDQIAKDSDIILIGKIKSVSTIAHRNKLSTKSSESSPSLPDPTEYMIGTDYLVEVSNTLTGKLRKSAKSEVHILVLGRGLKHNDPALIEGKRFLLFLKRAVIDKPFEDAVVLKFGEPGEVEYEAVDLKNYYSVAGGSSGAITGDDRIKEVVRMISKN